MHLRYLDSTLAIRNTFGNKAAAISKNVCQDTRDKKGFHTPDELLKIHPME